MLIVVFLVTFALSQSVWQFGKSRVIRTMCANVPNAGQLFIFTSQRAKKHTNVPKVCQLFNFACQLAEGMPIFQLRLPKGVPIFQLFFKIIFQFFNFLIMLNICKFQEYLGSSRKLISRNKDFKF